MILFAFTSNCCFFSELNKRVHHLRSPCTLLVVIAQHQSHTLNNDNSFCLKLIIASLSCYDSSVKHLFSIHLHSSPNSEFLTILSEILSLLIFRLVSAFSVTDRRRKHVIPVTLLQKMTQWMQKYTGLVILL